ncbi:unnamed protein product [Clonostachys solani]|uniref:Uncharacterized protein n=1 Tax=Clonostachys solani TaxID=160281 RepID=A0A9N9ZFP1_9HYPO|nr:unnamed protein product [Clonostachys solani]
MPSVKHVFAALATTAFTSVNAAMGPAWSTGPVGSGSWIREAYSTLILPASPTGSTGDLSLWVGMGTSYGDLIQSIADNWSSSSSWEVFTYTLKKTGDNSQTPIQGPSFAAKAGDKIGFHYKYDDSTATYKQILSVNSVTVYTMSTEDGHAEGFGSAVECAETNCGTVPAHSEFSQILFVRNLFISANVFVFTGWSGTTIILNTADPNYSQTLGRSSGVTGGDLSTSDGGKTWTATKITIPKHTF